MGEGSLRSKGQKGFWLHDYYGRIPLYRYSSSIWCLGCGGERLRLVGKENTFPSILLSRHTKYNQSSCQCSPGVERTPIQCQGGISLLGPSSNTRFGVIICHATMLFHQSWALSFSPVLLPVSICQSSCLLFLPFVVNSAGRNREKSVCVLYGPIYT